MPGTLLEVAARSAVGSDSAVARAMDHLPDLPTNVSGMERWLSLGVGSVLVANGLLGRRLSLLSLLAGGALISRAATGHCSVYQALGVNTHGKTGPNAAVAAGHGFTVDQTITVNAPVEEVYRFWRNFSRLPDFMAHLRHVKETDSTHSTWTAVGPAGLSVRWNAEIIEDQPGKVISWKSLDGSDVDTAGSVHFRPVGATATEIRVRLKYDPPGGKLGAKVAKLLGENPECQIRDDLARFKRIME